MNTCRGLLLEISPKPLTVSFLREYQNSRKVKRNACFVQNVSVQYKTSQSTQAVSFGSDAVPLQRGKTIFYATVLNILRVSEFYKHNLRSYTVGEIESQVQFVVLGYVSLCSCLPFEQIGLTDLRHFSSDFTRSQIVWTKLYVCIYIGISEHFFFFFFLLLLLLLFFFLIFFLIFFFHHHHHHHHHHHNYSS